MKYIKISFLLLNILALSNTVWAGNKKSLAQYDCVSSTFLKHVTDTYVKVGATICYIDIYRYEQHPYDIIVVNYVDEPITHLSDSAFGVIYLNNNAVAILSGTINKLFEKTRKKTKIIIETKNEIDELNDGLLESFIFDGFHLYRCDYKNKKRFMIDTF